MKINFKPTLTDGNEQIMPIEGMIVTSISFNYKTREIFVSYDDAPEVVEETDLYTDEEIDDYSWQRIKSLVLKHDGVWTNKQEGIEFLISLK